MSIIQLVASASLNCLGFLGTNCTYLVRYKNYIYWLRITQGGGLNDILYTLYKYMYPYKTCIKFRQMVNQTNMETTWHSLFASSRVWGSVYVNLVKPDALYSHDDAVRSGQWQSPEEGSDQPHVPSVPQWALQCTQCYWISGSIAEYLACHLIRWPNFFIILIILTLCFSWPSSVNWTCFDTESVRKPYKNYHKPQHICLNQTEKSPQRRLFVRMFCFLVLRCFLDLLSSTLELGFHLTKKPYTIVWLMVLVKLLG